MDKKVENFVNEFIEFARTKDSYLLTNYTAKELSKIGSQVDVPGMSRHLDLESIILNFIKDKEGDFSETEMSNVNEILFRIYSKGSERSSKALKIFERFTKQISAIPSPIRPNVIDSARRMLTSKHFDGPLDKKGKLLMSYTHAL